MKKPINSPKKKVQSSPMSISQKPMANSYALTIGWLYPEYMSTYGDRGNVITLQKRCEWRGIECKVLPIHFDTPDDVLATCDIILGGGSQDRQQELAIADMLRKKSVFQALFDRGVPGLFVCGSPQLLGHSYMTGDGKKLTGLGIFDMESRHFGHDKPRCIGNTVGQVDESFSVPGLTFKQTIVGFENHGGRTYLGTANPFAQVLIGYGNNGEDKTEGALYHNVIACYYHGPFLPKNPHIADWLLYKTLETKYENDISLEPLDDTLEWQAHEYLLHRSGADV